MLYLYLTSVCYSAACACLIVMIYYVRKNIKVDIFLNRAETPQKGFFVKERQRAVHTCRPEHWPSFSGDHYDHGSHYHQVCQRLPGRTTAQYQLRRERGKILNINLLEVDAIFLFQVFVYKELSGDK